MRKRRAKRVPMLSIMGHSGRNIRMHLEISLDFGVACRIKSLVDESVQFVFGDGTG
jgi:hypothetical protein